MTKCPHGQIDVQNPMAADEAAGWEQIGMSEVILEFYSACDCCGYLMHNSTDYQLLPDGRTLCLSCEVEPKEQG